MRRARRIAAACAAVASCAGPPGVAGQPGDLVINVQATGAVVRTGAFVHAGDSQHGCSYVAVPPYVEMRNGRPVEHPGLTGGVTVAFESEGAAGGADAVFILQSDGLEANAPYKLTMTAGGRSWQGSSGPGDRFEQRDGNGSFAIRDLANGQDHVSVQGAWACPR